MDPIRRKILAAGAAATAMTAAPRVFSQQIEQEGSGSFYERGPVRIHYEEFGSGFPLLLIPGGGLNSTIAALSRMPFNPVEEFMGEYRCIAADLRNANPGQSSGPLEIDRPWDSHSDDQLGLMDHLGIDKFMVLGFCIGGPFIWNMAQRAPNRIVAAVLTQPSGSRPEMRDGRADPARRCTSPPVCRGDGGRVTRAKLAGEPLPLEGETRTGPPGSAPCADVSGRPPTGAGLSWRRSHAVSLA